jgi:hypothetical protein
MNDAYFLMAKSISAFIAAGVLYVADSFLAQVESAPDWINSLGLPTAMLLLALIGLVGLFKALLEERKARISDRDSIISRLLSDAADAAEARATLIAEFRELRNELRK